MKNIIYQAVSKITEGREANGSYRGNGHHLAQEITDAVDAALKYFLYEDFVTTFGILASAANDIAREKGWWKGERNDGELIALMHSELSETLEALRHGNPASDHIPAFSGVEEELADVIIRIMDFAIAKKHRVGEAIIAKIEFNSTREVMHGNKKF
jgi:NTP pyrophosphatase (non-canonical NTP hydrolase)